jgi:signal transduction histidine kinase/predicted CoA-binding protein
VTVANEILKAVPLFADLSEADLDRLCEMLVQVSLDARETLFCEGDRGDRCYVIKEGEVEIYKASVGREILVAVRGPGEVIGEMALFEDVARTASARTRSATSLLAIEKTQLDELLRTSGTAARALFYTTLGRFRQTETMLRQSEKMAQLGTMSAGVAHELNNPAAAVKRGADQLAKAIEDYGLASAALRDPPRDLEAQVRERARRPPPLDPLERSDREAAAEEWLDAHGVEGAWQLAPILAGVGLDLGAVEARVDPSVLGATLRWLAASAAVQSLLEEVGQGATRISELVKSLKTYSYLDQAPAQDLDVREGIDSTIVMLRGKLKGIEVVRDYDPSLPRIHAWGSELNQVWTNLLDNACDAMDGAGTLRIRTRPQGHEWVAVEIEDSGPGIPPENVGRIFDAFFTTKPPGKGTGMGLEISWRIVVERHRGEVSVQSRPGSTVFKVLLPVDSTRPHAVPATARRVSDDTLRGILARSSTIAVVGLRDDPAVAAYTVPAYLQSHGYRIIPVNPGLVGKTTLGETAHADLRSVPEKIDIVLVFRRSDAVSPIVTDAIAVGAKVVWMQEGIRYDAAAADAEAHGIQVVMDTCMRSTHRRLSRPGS